MRCKNQAGNWQGVVYAETLPFSCSTEGTRKIKEIVDAKQLEHVVIAGCTCCNIDQVCYSCTYQRVRCKDQLHIFESSPLSGSKNLNDGEKFFFLNIREQCAWVHRDNPEGCNNKSNGINQRSCFFHYRFSPSNNKPKNINDISLNHRFRNFWSILFPIP